MKKKGFIILITFILVCIAGGSFLAIHLIRNIEVNEIDKKTQSIEELNLEEETPVLSLDTCDENLMEMYA